MEHTRRNFLKTSLALSGALVSGNYLSGCTAARKVRVSGHLWIYASRFPPHWDSTPVLDEVFSDFRYAGIGGVELMEVNLRHNDAVATLNALVEKHGVPVTGSSYSGDMWNKAEHAKILDDVELVVTRLHEVGGKNFGITVGNARRTKTGEELDAQADLLTKIITICKRKDVLPNLHNHTYEVENDLYDLKGTLARVPDIKLGPDLNWLVRAGLDPVTFIKTYGDRIVYMHIRDQTSDGTWTEAVGEGDTDFPSIADALKEIDYDGEAAIELASHIPPRNPMKENWKKSRDHVRQFFGW